MKNYTLFLLFLISFSTYGMSPGKSYKNYILKLQKNKKLTGIIKVGEDLYLDLGKPSERFVFEFMDIKILKEVINGNKGQVFFLMTWPLKSIAIDYFLEKEERMRLRKNTPTEYKELKKIGKKRVITVGTISSLKGQVTLYKEGQRWAELGSKKKSY